MIPNPYVVLALVLALLGSFGGGYMRGAHVTRASDQVEALTKTTNDLQAALDASKKAFDTQKAFADNALRVSALASAQAGQSDAQIETLIEERDNYVRKLQGSKCALTQSDVRSLRAIGGPPARPVSPATPRGAPGSPNIVRSAR